MFGKNKVVRKEVTKKPSLSKPAQYLEFNKRKADTSVWNHFLRAEDGQSGKCKLCFKILKCHGGATTGLHVHLKSTHAIDLKEKKNLLLSQSETQCSTSVTPSTSNSMPRAAKKLKMITAFFDTSLELAVKVSRMAALDGIPFSKFCTSEDLRDLFHKCGYNLPASGSAIRDIVLNQHKFLKKQLRQQISQDKTRRYSVSLDEYTSIRNRRYMNVNLHSDKFKDNFKNLGLVRIVGSMPAITAYHYLKQHLKEFAVDLDKDVVCLTSDGAAVMVKMGRYYKGYHQICLAHGLQLGVIDVLYKKENSEYNERGDTETRQEDFVAMDITDIVDISASEYVENEDQILEDNDDEDDEEIGGFEIEGASVQQEMEKRQLNFENVIEKIRKLVRSVRKSSLKNEAIQKYVVAEYGKELNLILDCKTRWSSLSDMIERFLKLRSAITKGFLDLDIVVPVNEEAVAVLKALHESLHVVKITVESLCQRDADLMTADTALKFMLKSLDSNQNGNISKNLAQSLRNRIKERRLPIASVLVYLYDSEDYHEDNFDRETFSKPTSNEMLEEIVKIIKRLDDSLSPEEENCEKSAEENVNEEAQGMSMKQKLQETIQRRRVTMKSKKKTTNIDLESLLRVEMAVFENGGGRGQYLTKCFEYLKTIPPTSVEAERAFSAVSNVCSRVRSSLKDNSLDALTFLKFHYQQKSI
ncbi:uncharacterized protein LOC132903749 isoform X1 [Amyelois transitella]|uniref:uncharacterized protein LOC106130788 isoform X1 n=1 Tax=Amyelois transitella TaxID=680683 RepID=UPI00067B2D70|nr:uncharacterized protein LOC106130788 isoform X1 [Amyelois transitella]XP_013188470.1 uncharacterized protein LOC106133323 isoform X1 [Amyelois transitella]XP_013191979.1 uncharacterized protein LOC106136082 isoform X1 [Amyelois transitella]XP_013192209.1 uncharacterized protein LOC132901750 isoform X1 [Amyelois transitella]XP_060800309.1 uncharacterized protein LOC106136082 isoform X1 [Amyelois transitella]XP_060801518.1 uncharacterized protein LOC132902008 isoform X1 [Amyelois transitella]